VSSVRAATARQQKLAAVYDAEIWPLVPARAAELILRGLPRNKPGSTVLEVGSATGTLALALAERMDPTSRVLGIDASPALIELAEAARGRHAAGSRVSFRLVDPPPPWTLDEKAYDLVVANLSLAEVTDPAATIASLARSLKPGGRFMTTVILRGSWTEFIDLYRDVLTEQNRREGLVMLQAHQATLPTAEISVRWLESAGLQQVTVEVARWELLFRSAREFFFAPVVELGPLPVWKQIAGGRGDEMQDVFFFVKEAIETYFSGSVFPVSMVVACLQGTRPTVSASVAR